MTLFKRKIYDKLMDWKSKMDGRYAVLLEGPRRVGKSTVVEAFAKAEYDSYILVNFADCPSVVRELFNDISDLNYIFLQLQLQYHVQLHKRHSVIIFDEVQFCPKARQAIKKLVADHRYDYIETGSLISIHKNVKDILIPSEEMRLYMYPMDFEEFLWACGDTTTNPLLAQLFEARHPVGASHRQMMRKFRLYMLVGGMPQAVVAYLSRNNLEAVDMVKREILTLYGDDFHKIDATGQLSLLFDSIPGELARNVSRYKPSAVVGRGSKTHLLESIAELSDSRTVLTAYHVNEPEPGLAASVDLTRYKLFCADTGLFVTLAFKDKDFTENTLYQKLLSDKLPANLGYLYENVLAQTLAASGNRLFYHTFANPNRTNTYEVDFLLSRGSKLYPLEVKSSGYKTHASLDAFARKYSQHVGGKILVYTKDLAKDGDTLCIPVYMAQFL